MRVGGICEGREDSRQAATSHSLCKAAHVLLFPTGALSSSTTASPADVTLDLLENPFLELRVATYRALSALLQREWMAAAVCSHAELLARLLSPQSESGRQGCEWRYACVRALAGTVRAVTAAGQQLHEALGNGLTANGTAGQHQRQYSGQYRALLAAVAQQIDDAAAQGPYGLGSATPKAFQVATISRGGGQ